MKRGNFWRVIFAFVCLGFFFYSLMLFLVVVMEEREMRGFAGLEEREK